MPAVTISVCPSGCACQAVRAPGWKLTLAQPMREGSGGLLSGSMVTSPVNHMGGPFCEGRDPARFSSMVSLHCEPSLTRFAGEKEREPGDARAIAGRYRSAWQRLGGL